MLTCREAAARAAELHSGELTLLNRVSLRLHLIMCRHCQRRVHQMGLLLRTLRILKPDAGEIDVAGVLQSVRKQAVDRGPAKPAS